ncbi:MAG: hypothetical protein E5Y31_17890 [Mesorhizobium sp.]|nr:MAG: hypothetical protein E5Y31_17890 [Mesorhizobium sp.]
MAILPNPDPTPAPVPTPPPLPEPKPMREPDPDRLPDEDPVPNPDENDGPPKHSVPPGPLAIVMIILREKSIRPASMRLLGARGRLTWLRPAFC